MFVSPGTLLLSMPQLRDPNFMHTVVLICEHGQKGAYGLVVNKQTELTLDQLVPEHPLLGEAELTVYEGGPVGQDTLQILHRAPEHVTSGVEIASGLFLGGDLDSLAKFVDQEPEARDHVRLFLGYSGWGAGQLDGELAIGSWVPAPLELGLLFDCQDQQATWREAMRGSGRDGEGLSHQPPDPTWN